MKKLRYFTLLLILAAFSCKFNMQEKNNIKDKEEGENVMNTFFENIKSGNIDINKDLLSNSFLKISGVEQFDKDQKFIERKLGRILSIDLIGWETSIVSGPDPKAEYTFEYHINRENYDSNEIYYLLKENDGSIKINSYKIDSRGFVEDDL